MSVGNKARILRLCQILCNETDVDHFMETNELIDMIRSEGFEINRKTFRDDIDTLISMGMPLKVIKSSPNKYYCNRKIDIELLKKFCKVVTASNAFDKGEIETLQKAFQFSISKYQASELNEFAANDTIE